ncbi:MAG: hypothetical protein LBE60_11100 [Microbacterium sp.]|jgi:hypothetical protein|uniref:hypothetical protein n=1 Tax=Microbacterium sp. TaxID=51671 RepID=UPI002836CAD3|nr:hypothetical protein [Microbacterium sp.]MDR2322180.1 hypothetical protein [Microbacterium sp.]
MIRVRFKALCTAAVVAALALSASPAFASGPATTKKAPAAAQVPAETRVDIPLSAAQTLADAQKIREIDGRPVVAYRFENNEIVGEFAVNGPASVAEYLNDFDDRYGTQPQVVAAVVVMPTEDAKERFTSRKAAISVPAQGDAFVASPADSAKIDAMVAERQSAADQSRSAVAPLAEPLPTWKPNTADIQIKRFGADKIFISQYYNWNGSTAKTANLSADDGFEAEVNAWSWEPALQSGIRDGCNLGDYKDWPFAKNYNWDWEVLVIGNSGIGPVASNVGAYADYNDLSDQCNRNSLAIGLRTPQVLPVRSNGQQDVMFNITAPRGKDDFGGISGLIQPVNGTSCVLTPWLSLTDCMGLTNSANSPRYTLSTDRAWSAPTRCWISSNFGDDDPILYISGC